MTAWPASDGVATVVDLLRWRAQQTPNAIAFHQQDTDGRWVGTSWHLFDLRVRALALGLQRSGVKPGDRWALVAPVSLEWELLHHAALAAGCVVVGLDAHDSPQRLARLVQLAGVRHLACADVALMATLSAAALEFAATGLRLHMAAGPERRTDPARGDNPGLPGLEAIGEHGSRTDGHSQAPEPAPAPRVDDEATIIFTSGTTGAPKGIVYRHGQLLAAALAIQRSFDFIGAEGRLLCWLPLSNLFQRMVNLAAIRSGTASYLLQDPRQVVAAAGQVEPDILVGVPRFFEKLLSGVRERTATMPAPLRQLVLWAWATGRRWQALQRTGLGHTASPWLRLQHAVADRLVLSRVRRVLGRRIVCMVSGSAPAPQPLLEELHALGWLVLEAYGLSENVMPMSMNRLLAWRFGTVGQPLPGNQIRLDGQGQLHVRGEGVFAGYLGSPAETAVDAEGYYPTGDIGSFDSDGYLVLKGRTSELIKTSTGKRVAPAPIEAALTAVPGIDQAIVLGDGRKQLVALCTVTEGCQRHTLPAALQQAVASLPPAQQPAAIALLDQVFSMAHDELTPNLKLRRQVIASRYAARIEALFDALEHHRPGSILIQ